MGSSVSTEVKGTLSEDPDSSIVYFCTKATPGGSCSSQSSAEISACVDHWVLAFEYADVVLVCDAVADKGVLTGRCRYFDKTSFDNHYPSKMRTFQGNRSKTLVESTVNSMKKWGQYDVVFNNCQNWVQKLMFTLQVRPFGWDL